MSTVYSMYHLEQHQAVNFDTMYANYAYMMPPLPNKYSNEFDQKAAVFNTWVRYCNFEDVLILKPEKTFTHSFPLYLMNYIQNNMPIEVLTWVKNNYKNEEYMYFFTYFLTKYVLEELEAFLNTELNVTTDLFQDYYKINNYTVDENNAIYTLFKVLHTTFIGGCIDSAKCKKIYMQTFKDTSYYLSQFFNI